MVAHRGSFLGLAWWMAGAFLASGPGCLIDRPGGRHYKCTAAGDQCGATAHCNAALECVEDGSPDAGFPSKCDGRVDSCGTILECLFDCPMSDGADDCRAGCRACGSPQALSLIDERVLQCANGCRRSTKAQSLACMCRNCREHLIQCAPEGLATYCPADAGAVADGGRIDAGRDAGREDAGPTDAGHPDAGAVDAGRTDGGADAGVTMDAGADGGVVTGDAGGPVDGGSVADGGQFADGGLFVDGGGIPLDGGPISDGGGGDVDAGAADAGGGPADAGCTDAGFSCPAGCANNSCENHVVTGTEPLTQCTCYQTLVVPDSTSLIANSTGLTTCLRIIAQQITVQAGGRISADGMGNPWETRGMGRDARTNLESGSGGGHGGFGGDSTTLGRGAYYGQDSDAAPPCTSGSRGGHAQVKSGGAGGGAISLEVFQSIIIDGTVSSRGLAGQGATDITLSAGGGGSGGSIQIKPAPGATGASWIGTGLISAEGGAAGGDEAGSGGGGRIFIDFPLSSAVFAGMITAAPGFTTTLRDVQREGNPGVLQFPSTALDTSSEWVVRGSYSVVPRTYNVMRLQVTSGTRAEPNRLVLLTRDPNTGVAGASHAHVIAGGCGVSACIEVGTNASVDSDGQGYAAGGGPQPGISSNTSITSVASGGGHGGRGGDGATVHRGGRDADPWTSPQLSGSGGGGSSGGYGGGVVDMACTGCAIALDGTISALGEGRFGALPGGTGGGAGGSIVLSGLSIAGAGSILATGGNAGDMEQGGGGGGRVSVNADMSAFTGALDVSGGSGFRGGQVGTYFHTAFRSTGSFPAVSVPQSWVIGLYLDSALAFQSLDVHGTLLLQKPATVCSALVTCALQPHLTVQGKMTVHPTGLLSSDAEGFPPTMVLVCGEGGTVMDKGGGGGFGGKGGNSDNGAAGGVAYSCSSGDYPGYLGGSSGGGKALVISGQATRYAGGHGGGGVIFSADEIEVQGTISADGEPRLLVYSGGGSGGGLSLVAGHIYGGGVIRARGAAGAVGSGGGAGGRIRLCGSVGRRPDGGTADAGMPACDVSGAAAAYHGGSGGPGEAVCVTMPCVGPVGQ